MTARFVGTVLYDDACGFCRRWVPFWAGTLRRRGFDIAPLQSSWATQQLGLPSAELVDDLRLLLPTGTQIQGAEVYRFVMRRIWWAYPFFLLSRVPGLHWLFNYTYRRFARGRHEFSRACGLELRTRV